MSTFTQRVQFIRHPDYKGLYKITRKFRFYLREDKTGEYIEVPVGAITNFASLPWFIRWLWRPDADDVRAPSVMHDCAVGEFNVHSPVMLNGEVVRYLTWQEAAYWLRAGLEARGCPGYKRQIFYRSVLLYGWWRRKFRR